YYRIKILNKAGFDNANITINLYKKKYLKDLKAITYNLNGNQVIKNHLQEKDIFETQDGDDWSVYKFTFSNIKEGSVLEYKYSIISPYLSINDWAFQSDVPKVKSEFEAAILGNYKYNIRLIGYLKLNKNEVNVKKKCIYIDGVGDGNCVVYEFGMNNIPAFKEEDYMLSKRNYMSRLSFDLESYTSFRGVKKDYTTSWKEADKILKSQFFNNQISKKSFFKRRLPDSILTTKNELEKAKKVYAFIQNHFTWNQKYWTNEDAKVKNAFKETIGDVGEINLSLYNSLNAADIDANLVVLSTRNHGIPTKLFPVIYDYNYVIVKANINNKDYFLDATSKYLPFGQVPVRTLNGEARIMNFNKEGNWVILKPLKRSARLINTRLVLNEDGIFSGSLMIRKSGYYASKHREKLATISEETYLDDFESRNDDLEILEYKVENLNNLEKTVSEIYKINISMDENLANTARINPFLFDRLEENPFKLSERNYPVDFGYPFNSNFSLSLKIPDNYSVEQLPKGKAVSLPNNGGVFFLKASNKENVISLFVRFNLTKRKYSSEEYFALKEFFKQIIIAENTYIVLKKKNE
ncbi:hypothetical protein, partial [Polaribacter sp.]|uniref:hypothetical protein n=1 Tax=Polaribacter sp. TaxID=1920175 RepID=UPI003F6ADC2A